MLEHTKTHPISSLANNPLKLVFYVSHERKTYAIPVAVAEKYVLDKESVKALVPAKIVFAKLEKDLTKAGALLKGLRTREALSQVAFAEKIKLTQANLSNMENGRRPIGKIVAKRIEKIFAVDYRYFLG